MRRIPKLLLTGAALCAAIASSTAAFQSRTQHTLAQGQQFTNGGRQLLSISQDGSQIVYVANNSLYVKAMAAGNARLVEGTNSQGAVTNPVFSPDGKFIAFWSGQDSTLKRIPVGGGTPQTISQAANPHGMSWGADDNIVFGQGAGGIRRVRATGGTAETIVTMKSGDQAHGPQILSGGDALLYTLATNATTANPGGIPPELLSLLNPNQLEQLRNNAQLLAGVLAQFNSSTMWDRARIVVQSLKTNETKTLIEVGNDARYAPTGHLVYAVAGQLMAVKFDAARLEVSGSPVKLVEGVRTAGGATGTAQFSFSNTGSLVYLGPDSPIPQRELSLVDLSGKVTRMRHVPPNAFGPRISPDGKQVTYSDNGAVWVVELATEAPPRRLTNPESGVGPIWSLDGQRIAFISIFNNQEALFWRRADGTGTAELLADRARAPESWAADNQSFTYITLVGPAGDAGDYDIWSYSIRDKKASPLIVVPNSAQSGSRLSPDGKWIAYESNETGRAEVWVEPLPRTSQRIQITTTGGARPVWAPDMSKLYFDNNNGAAMRMISVDVRTQPAFSFSNAQTLPMTGFVQPQGTYRRQFDITSDGKQFLMMFQPPPAPPQIEIVTNWFDQLRK
jgi:eukaryotic-like serine/threonine-protein kinase